MSSAARQIRRVRRAFFPLRYKHEGGREDGAAEVYGAQPQRWQLNHVRGADQAVICFFGFSRENRMGQERQSAHACEHQGGKTAAHLVRGAGCASQEIRKMARIRGRELRS